MARETGQNNYLWTDQDFPIDAVGKLWKSLRQFLV